MTCNMMQKSYGSTFKVSFLSVLKLSSCVYQQSVMKNIFNDHILHILFQEECL